MDFTPLTQAQRSHFDEQGYLIVRRALEPDQVARLIEVGDHFMGTAGEVHNFYANRYIDLTLDPVLTALTVNPRVLPLVVQLLTHDLHLMRGNIIYKYPQPESATPQYPDGDGRSFRNWHRDLNNFAPNHPIRNTVAIRAGYCLTDFSQPNSGVTMLVPGSHKLTAPLRFTEGALDPPNFVEPQLEAGDAYLFSTSTYHTPSVNFTDATAKGYLVSYAYRWWNQGCPRPSEEVLEGMGPIEAQLFGKQYEGLETPLKEWARSHGLDVEDPPMRVFD
ncbi:MAG: hypothetical protein GKR89_30485 [Candidatus Latescibacteria bacterium]|nr:hypothetical protein [Candidatus Latescibacterota bacterium]